MYNGWPMDNNHSLLCHHQLASESFPIESRHKFDIPERSGSLNWNENFLSALNTRHTLGQTTMSKEGV